jgi:predicted nucleotidyltransferase
MNELIDLSETKLTDEDKAAVKAFCENLRDAPNIELKSITLYGSATRRDYIPGKSDINLLVVVERIDVSILKNVLDPVARSRRFGIAPFFITEMDLRSSADVFPVKFLAIREAYHVLLGSDILRNLEIRREHLRLRCEQEIKNLLLRLRRHYIMGGGQRLTEMMSQMIVSFTETLRAVLSFTQEDLPSRGKVVDAAAKTFGFDAEILYKVRNLRTRDVSLTRKEAEQLYDKFMATVEKVAQLIDQME